MKTFARWTVLTLFVMLALTGIAGLFLSASAMETSTPTPTLQTVAEKPFVLLIKIDDPITPVIAEYIIKSIDRATEKKAEALVILMDTPGGLVESTREIVKKMLASEVPTVVYVAPSGSRAASAGVNG
jgi:membrane-bound ClpP family serine protease